MSRVLSFLTDIIIFLFSYCFIFVSVLILFFDRNTDYDRFIDAFYIFLFIGYYLYFILPLYFKGQTIGKRIFKISVYSNKGFKNICKFNLKYLVIRLLPILSILLIIGIDSIIIKVLSGLFIIYPIFDYYYLKANEISFTDKLLKIEMKSY